MSQILPSNKHDSKAEQLALFDDFVTRTPEGYSNTIELFDAILKYSSRRVRKTPEPDIRTVVFRSKEVRVTISPAVIKRRGAPAIIVMPGQREDLVEKALRKLAAETVESWGVELDQGQGGRPAFSLRFTLYQIRKLLAETGHDFKTVEIDEALRVLQGANIEFDGAIDDYVTGQVSGILTSYTYVKRRKDRTGSKSYGEVKFHPLVNASIVQRTFRRIDFRSLMELKVDLARWIYQRMSHNYVQASTEDLWDPKRGYHISLSTILRESGMDRRMRMRDNLKVVRAALANLKETNLLGSYSEDLRKEKPTGKPGRTAIVDAVWLLKPSVQVIDDVIEANRTAKKLRDETSHPRPAALPPIRRS